jgi:hypothetical protein
MTTRLLIPIAATASAGLILDKIDLTLIDRVAAHVAAFNPVPHSHHKMEARGLLYRQPEENRLSLTSLRILSPTCNG